MINKRLFGTPIQGDVRKKLEARQQVAGEVGPGESLDGTKTINGVFSNQNGDIQVDLSSRTPFVRMWTSLKLIKPEALADAAATEISKEEIDEIGENAAVAKAKKITKDPLGVEYSNTMVNEIRDDDGNLIKIIIKDEKHRDQVDYVRKTYIVGDYNYQKSYGTPSPNDSVGLSIYTKDDPSTENVNEQEQIKQTADLLFPQRLKTNPLLKPQAGITGLSSETQDSLGVIKTTTVNFTVHNFYDFDRIYNKYFLKPGATIFVDFGWSSIKNLYNPEELLNFNGSGGIQEYLYGESKLGQVDGQVTKNQGDLEVIQGIVKDYNAKILSNGSVECSVTLTSANSALLNFNTPDDFEYRLKSILTRGVLFYGIGALAAQSNDTETINTLLTNPQSDADVETIDTYNDFITNKALLQLANSSSPTGDSIRAGVYVDSLNVDNVYITWGLFEDFIINSQFAFGKSQSDITNGTGFQVTLDSSNSMTKWSSKYVENQSVLLQVAEEPPMFLFPEWWNTSDPDESIDEGGGSYSYKKNKWPEESYLEKYPDNDSSEYTKEDEKLEIIPIREVFINVDTIMEAFREEKSIKKVINKILSDLNDSSPLFDWKIKVGNTDSQIQIVDTNMVEAEVRAKLLEEPDESRYFTFNIMSPNSIVKDYNLELKIPSDDIGNYYALQGTSHDNNLFSVDPQVKKQINTLGLDTDSKSIIYEPDNGGYRAEQSLDKKNDSEAFNVFETLKPLIKGEVITSATTPKNEDDDNKSRSDKNKKVPSPADIFQNIDLKALQKITEKNEQNESFKGNKVANSIKEYYQFQLFGTDVATKISDMMPYTLSLTTYGIGSIQPGDTFRVDYLPKIYLENSYVQTMKVSHNVNSDGWYTSLDTQFRTKIENHQNAINNVESVVNGSNIVLSPKVLSRLNLNMGEYASLKDNPDTEATQKVLSEYLSYDIRYLEPFMTNVTVKPYYGENEDTSEKQTSAIIIKFKTPKKFDKAMKMKYIHRHSLYAETLHKASYETAEGEVKVYDDFTTADGGRLADQYNLGDGIKGRGKVKRDQTRDEVTNQSETRSGPIINPGSDFNKVYLYGTKEGKLRHRVYAPCIMFEPDTEYEIFIVGQNFCVFDLGQIDATYINNMKKLFSENGPEVKIRN